MLLQVISVHSFSGDLVPLSKRIVVGVFYSSVYFLLEHAIYFNMLMKTQKFEMIKINFNLPFLGVSLHPAITGKDQILFLFKLKLILRSELFVLWPCSSCGQTHPEGRHLRGEPYDAVKMV